MHMIPVPRSRVRKLKQLRVYDDVVGLISPPWAQQPIGPLTRVRIGDAQPVRRLVGPLSRSTIRGSGGHRLNERGSPPPL
jgi:hypothetical protein